MLRPLTPRSVENGISLLIAAAAFTLYAATRCPTTDFIDSGELSTVVSTLGIAHPTGYPLFTLVGWVFAHLPVGLRVIERVNLMAALFCASALAVFFRFLLVFLALVSPFPAAGQQGAGGRRRGAAAGSSSSSSSGGGPAGGAILPLSRHAVYWIPAAAGTLLLGFSETFWSQATAVEVYSLHCLMLSVLLLLFCKTVSLGPPAGEGDHPPAGPAGRMQERGAEVRWYAFAFVLGLAFTNHMTTILLAPAFLFLYFSTGRFASVRSWTRLGRMAVPFLLGFSLYLYLPFRAGQHPLMNWGNPVSPERFLWHLTGKQYRVWIFSSTESAMRQLAYFADSVLPEFASVPLLLAPVGLWSLVKRNRTLLVFTLLLFFGCLLYSINYDIHDIDSYFLLAYFTLALWCAVGLQHLLLLRRPPQPLAPSSAGRRPPRPGFMLAAAAAPLLLGAYVAAVNYPKADESRSVLVEDYTRDVFRSVGPGAIVLSYQWDYFVSAAYYFQIVENLRPDVVVIDKELLRRSWYYPQLEHRYPWLIRQSRREVDAFLAELWKFEHDLPYDPGAIEMRFREVIRSFLAKNSGGRPVYATAEIEPEYTDGYQRVPSGLVFRLYADTLTTHPAPLPEFTFHVPPRLGRLAAGVVSQYAKAYLNHAIYAFLRGNLSLASRGVDKALQVDPGMPEALYWRDKLRQAGG